MTNSPYGEPDPNNPAEQPQYGQKAEHGQNTPEGQQPYGGQQAPNWGAPAGQQSPYQQGPYQPGQHQQAPQAASSKFGTSTYDPVSAGAPMQKPAKQSLLEKLTLISMGLYLVATVAFSAVFASDEVAEFFTDVYSEMGMTQEEIDAVVEMLGGMAIAGGVFGVVVALGLYLLVYIPLTKGKSWARVLGLVLAFIGVISTLLNFFGFGAIMFSNAAGLLAAVAFLGYVGVTIYWIVVAFNDDVKRYLAQQSA